MSRRIQSTELQPRPAPQCCPGSLGRNPLTDGRCWWSWRSWRRCSLTAPWQKRNAVQHLVLPPQQSQVTWPHTVDTNMSVCALCHSAGRRMPLKQRCHQYWAQQWNHTARLSPPSREGGRCRLARTARGSGRARAAAVVAPAARASGPRPAGLRHPELKVSTPAHTNT